MFFQLLCLDLHKFNFCGRAAMPGTMWTNALFLATMEYIFLEEAGHLLF